MRALLATVPGVTEADLAGFVSIVDGSWTDAAVTPAQFVDAKLAALVDTTPITAAIVASPTEAQQTTLLLAITTALSSYAYTRTKQELATAAVADTFGFSADVSATVLAGAELTRPLLAVLTDDALVDLVNEPPAPPAATSAGFDEQYRALRLLHVLSRLVDHLTVPDADLGWLLANAGSLGWLAPDRVPYQTGRPPAPLADWIRLAAGVELARTYPPVANPLDAAAPWTVYGLFDLVVAAGTTATQVHTHLAQLAGWDATTLADLDTHLELSAANLTAYRSPVTIQRLADALTLLRRLGLPVAAAVPLGQPVTTAAGVATMRQALKARYAEAEWLGVLQGVQDRLRVAKRDALVAYLLAENPALRDTNDLYDYFLIDVEMGACMATSRIVQAHATVQLFVQRCLLGLEPDSVAAVTEDRVGTQWSWMANYRVWEANRKIFLYPENWIQPELRDDKSELFTQLDDQLQQDELTDLAVENATIAYLEKLDDLAHLDVMAVLLPARQAPHARVRPHPGRRPGGVLPPAVRAGAVLDAVGGRCRWTSRATTCSPSTATPGSQWPGRSSRRRRTRRRPSRFRIRTASRRAARRRIGRAGGGGSNWPSASGHRTAGSRRRSPRTRCTTPPAATRRTCPQPTSSPASRTRPGRPARRSACSPASSSSARSH